MEKEREKIEKNELVDISTVKIDMSLPVKERVRDYVRQIRDPYHYISNGMKVTIRFAGKSRLEECLKTALFPDVK